MKRILVFLWFAAAAIVHRKNVVGDAAGQYPTLKAVLIKRWDDAARYLQYKESNA